MVNLPGTLSAFRIDDTACKRQVGCYWRAGRIMRPLATAFRSHFSAFARERVQMPGLAGP